MPSVQKYTYVHSVNRFEPEPTIKVNMLSIEFRNLLKPNLINWQLDFRMINCRIRVALAKYVTDEY